MYKFFSFFALCCSNKEEEKLEDIVNITPQVKEMSNSPPLPEQPQNDESTFISEKNRERLASIRATNGQNKKAKRNKQRRSANIKLEKTIDEVIPPITIIVHPQPPQERKPLKGILKKPKK